ncbi:MAG: hypothetical protein JRI55_32220, partial [Deltaproteobacteria bacterium]|nr:hypothetical protein [Deltaproteobacteria bacterium]
MSPRQADLRGARQLVGAGLFFRLLAAGPAASRPADWPDLVLAGHLLALLSIVLVGLGAVRLRRLPLLGAAALSLLLEAARLVVAVDGAWSIAAWPRGTGLALGAASIAAQLEAGLPLLSPRVAASLADRTVPSAAVRTLRAGLIGLLAVSAVGYPAQIAGYVLHLDRWVQWVSLARLLGVVASATAMLVALSDLIRATPAATQRPLLVGL